MRDRILGTVLVMSAVLLSASFSVEAAGAGCWTSVGNTGGCRPTRTPGC